MIKPTVGRVVWFAPAVLGSPHVQYTSVPPKPLCASVAYVWNDRMVNLSVVGHDGVTKPETSVMLLQDDDRKPEEGRFAFWMPYQQGQAAKTEAAESRLAAGQPAKGG